MKRSKCLAKGCSYDTAVSFESDDPSSPRLASPRIVPHRHTPPRPPLASPRRRSSLTQYGYHHHGLQRGCFSPPTPGPTLNGVDAVASVADDIAAQFEKIANDTVSALAAKIGKVANRCGLAMASSLRANSQSVCPLSEQVLPTLVPTEQMTNETDETKAAETKAEVTLAPTQDPSQTPTEDPTPTPSRTPTHEPTEASSDLTKPGKCLQARYSNGKCKPPNVDLCKDFDHPTACVDADDACCCKLCDVDGSSSSEPPSETKSPADVC